MPITVKSDRQNSPVLSGDRPIAAKAMIATAVAPSSGVDVWPVTSRAASSASMPPLIRTNIPSMMTIALSTSMPSAMISAPSEMRSSATPAGPMKMNVPQIVSTSTKPMIKPLRSPMKSNRTTITMPMASSRLMRNASIAVVTMSDCM